MAKTDKLFKTSMFGYSKKKVQDKVKSLEEENRELKEQIELVKEQYEAKKRSLEVEAENLENSKKQIADAYIEAQKNADDLLEQAKNSIAMERHVYEIENEALKELIVERKEAIRNIRLSVQTFSTELEKYFENVIKNLSSDINVAVKQLDYEHLEKISAELEEKTDETEEG